MINKIFLHYGTRMQAMICALMEAADVSSMIKPSMHVVIKPNLVVSRPATGHDLLRNVHSEKYAVGNASGHVDPSVGFGFT